MSRKTVTISPEGFLNTRADEASSRDELHFQNGGGASTQMILAPRPRTCDCDSESARAVLKTSHGNSEESQHRITPYPPTTFTSNRNGSQAFLTDTTIHLAPIEPRNPVETQRQEKIVHHQITQNGIQFKSHVKGIKIIIAQVTSKPGQYASRNAQPGDGEQNNQPQGQGKEDSGFVNQTGAHFFQSVTDSNVELSQSVSWEDFYIIKQDAVDIDGEVVGGSFISNQRV